jgi:cytochrome c-type biogenesis protein CcsB
MTLEILFKNGIFFTLFLSMLSFWGENLFFNQSKNPAKLTKNPGLEKPTESFESSQKFFGVFPLILSGSTFSFSESFFLLSFFFITSELLFRWFSSGHPPLSNLYESLLFFIWGLIGFFLFLNQASFNETIPSVSSNQLALTGESTRFPLRNFLGGLLSSAALFIETFADWRLPSEMKEMKPLIPALQSNWLLMHVSIMILSYAALLIGCLLAISYIALSFSQGKENEKSETNLTANQNQRSEYPLGPTAGNLTKDPIASVTSAPVGLKMQSVLVDPEIEVSPRSAFLTDLDSLSFRVLAFGFPLLTLGILSGAVWANEAWGSYWSWDPKETWAFITWLIFAFYLHTRLQYGWEGKKSAFVATFGFFILWICYLGVNLLGKGLHSYGWLS